jgi:hypothetical protein
MQIDLFYFCFFRAMKRWIHKITGHPLVLFGEKFQNFEIRLYFLKKLFLENFYKEVSGISLKKNLCLFCKLKRKLGFHYYSKIGNRKKIYQYNWKLSDFFQSCQIIDKSIQYETGLLKKNLDYKKSLLFSNFYLTKIVQLVSEFPLKPPLFCFQPGESGFFYTKNHRVIVLKDLRKRNNKYNIKSSLIKIDFLSSHFNFPSCFLASNSNCSEFWKIDNSYYRTSLNLIYHKDPVTFQRYRKIGNYVDFVTSSMKWKCFDEVAQKFLFAFQFREKILNLSITKDNSLTAVGTRNNLYIIDNRTLKKIACLKINCEKYFSILWTHRNTKLILIGNKIKIWEIVQQKCLTIVNLDLRINPTIFLSQISRSFIIRSGKKLKEFLEIFSKKSIPFLNISQKLNLLAVNQTGTLLALNNKKEINIYSVR